MTETKTFATLQTANQEIRTEWQPNGNYLMLQPILLPEVSEGGIILPSDTYRKTNRGIVLKRGPGCDPSSPFRPGVEVFFPANTDYTIEVEGDSVYLVRETDIIMFRSTASPAHAGDPDSNTGSGTSFKSALRPKSKDPKEQQDTSGLPLKES